MAAEDKSMKNVVALTEFRMSGTKVPKGVVVAKSDFRNKGDWQNLLHMTPPRVAETSDAVGAPKADKADKADKAVMPGATK